MSWNLTLEQKDRFLELMDSMGAHSMWFLDGIVEKLIEVGLPASIDTENNCLLLGGVRVELTQPKWGEAGIYAPNVLSLVIEHFGYEINSNMNGKGFHFKDRLQHLASHWGLEKTYL
jgi:hypothetical protein